MRKTFTTRKAFTIIELIVVIVIVAILSAIAIPRLFVEDKLAQAAEEIITNLRYTQHLALTEDQFTKTTLNWEHRRWRMGFRNLNGNSWTYTVYKGSNYYTSGPMSASTPTKPCGNNIAVDPFTKKCLGTSSGLITDEQVESTALTLNRDINPAGIGAANQGVQLSASCEAEGDILAIGFDELGRPFAMKNHDAYSSATNWPAYFRNTCRITLVASDLRRLSICVQPETGSIDYCPGQ
ncbi:hypothetical protein FACS189487_03120 [Campylobacterota bacterium]|nr:hypothetical protein FACS189487_03120 [Campylobacterota bacterium]